MNSLPPTRLHLLKVPPCVNIAMMEGRRQRGRIKEKKERKGRKEGRRKNYG
jgi:hypothetical protein